MLSFKTYLYSQDSRGNQHRPRQINKLIPRHPHLPPLPRLPSRCVRLVLLLCLVVPVVLVPPADYDYYYDYGPSDQPELETILVLFNTHFNVTCSKAGSRVGLYHNGRIADGAGARISRAESGNAFVVRHAEFSDSGRWSCQSQGTMDEINVIVSDVENLSVLVGGELVRSSTVIYLRRDSAVDLVCAKVSEPGKGTDSLRWDDGSNSLTHSVETFHPQEGFSYSLAKLSSQVLLTSNIKQIFCSAGGKQINLKIVEEFRPEFTISRNPGFGVPIMEDMTVSLKCSVDSNPPSVPIWEHNGVPIPSNQLNQTNTAEISFERISLDNDGWFQCSTQHKFGNFSSVGYYLSVKPKPMVTEPDSVTTSSMLSEQVLLVESGPEKGRRGECGDGNQITDFTLPKVSPARNTGILQN